MALDVRSFTVGRSREHLRRARSGSASALLIDPGDEPERLIAGVDALGVSVEASC